MKTAKILKEQYVETKESKIANDLGLDESDLATIRSKLLGEEEKKEELDYIRIGTCVPYTLVVTENKEENKLPVATLLCLCTNADTKDMFTLMHNYIVDDAEDYRKLKGCALNIENQPRTEALIWKRLSTLDQYNSDFELYTIDSDEHGVTEKDVFYTLGHIKFKEGGGKILKMYMDYNIANIICNTDDYIRNEIYDDFNTKHMQGIVCLESDPENPKYAKHIFVDSIDSIISLAVINKKANTYCVSFKIDNPFSKNDTDKYLTIVLDIQSIKKLKPNVSFEEITSEAKKDRYIHKYDFTGTINEKEYTCIQVLDGQDNIRMLYMDEDTNTKLMDMIQKTFGK